MTTDAEYAAVLRRLSLLGHRLRHPSRPMSILRAYWWCIVGYEGETCHRCCRRYALWFAADDLWAEIVGHDNGLLCPSCFDREAELIGLVLEWVPRRQPMTDAEHAAALRRHADTCPYLLKHDERAAIERAIELLEREAPRMMTSIWPSKAGGDTVAHRDKP